MSRTGISAFFDTVFPKGNSNKLVERGPWSSSDSLIRYDYVILGGGTAGCILASRLAENPKVNVLILEAGQSDDIKESMTPALWGSLTDPKVNWGSSTIPQPHANGRCLPQPRGKLLGGSSSINVMFLQRGPASDYDEWGTFGNPGWSYKECLHYFKKAEGFIDPNLPVGHPKGPATNRVRHPQYEQFEPEFHGTDGPWQISYQHLYDSSVSFIEACIAEGIPFNRDHNGTINLGVNRVQTSIQRDAIRSSTARSYLSPQSPLVKGKTSAERGKVRIVFGAHITRILMQKHRETNVAIGAEFLDEKNVLHSVYAAKEVLLCAGSYGSPHILLASGIGPSPHPTIPHVHTLPGVGQGLTDHPRIKLIFKANPECHTPLSGRGFLKNLKSLYDYKVNGVGKFSSQLGESACFLRLEDVDPEFVEREKANGTWRDTSSGPKAPHIEIIFMPGVSNSDGIDTSGKDDNYYTINGILLNPVSRGEVTISDVKDGKTDTLINLNILGDEFDVRVLAVIVKYIRKIAGKLQQDPTCGGVEVFPGLQEVPENDKGKVHDYIRNSCYTMFHPVSTCHMGPTSDPLAVVDARLNVYGVDRLRVVDASIMPKLPAAHTCPATVMIAEKASDMIKEDWVDLPNNDQSFLSKL